MLSKWLRQQPCTVDVVAFVTAQTSVYGSRHREHRDFLLETTGSQVIELHTLDAVRETPPACRGTHEHTWYSVR